MSISTFFLIAFVLPAIVAMLLVEGCRRCKPLWAIISAIGIFLIPTIIIAMFLGISAAFSGTGLCGLLRVATASFSLTLLIFIAANGEEAEG